MTIQVATLKIDFKFDESEIVRIIDVGDGLGASNKGFSEESTSLKMLQTILNETGAVICPVFGELPADVMNLKNVETPVMLRQPPATHAGDPLIEGNDLKNIQAPLFPYSRLYRLQPMVAYVWGQKSPNVISTPPTIAAMERHKILWYLLMEKFMPKEKQQKISYWHNATNPHNINTDGIKNTHGFFIKIADRSTGGAKEVYFAANNNALISILEQLHQQKTENHIFIIEPAYMTRQKHKGQEYNVTGRAFLNLFYDEENDEPLKIEIAAAKWMFPKKQLRTNFSQEQMLSNNENTINLVDLTAKELSHLSSNLLETYSEVFKATFNIDDLITHFANHPQIKSFKTCLRPNSTYHRLLETTIKSNQQDSAEIRMLLYSTACTLISHSVLSQFNQHFQQAGLLSTRKISDLRLAQKNSTISVKKYKKSLMSEISYFSLIKNFSTEVMLYPEEILNTPSICDLVNRQTIVELTLNNLIAKYLQLTNKRYDKKDFNRALRQAAFLGDAVVMKLLIYTGSANVDAVSPTGKTVFDNATRNKNEENKARCLRIIEQATTLCSSSALTEHPHPSPMSV